MASVALDPVSDQYHIRFRFAGQAFKSSLKTEATHIMSTPKHK